MATVTDFPKWMVDDLAKSGINPHMATERGFKHVNATEIKKFTGVTVKSSITGYTIPYIDPVTGQVKKGANGKDFIRIKLSEESKGCKYLSPIKAGNRCFIPKEVHDNYTADLKKLVLLTEGEKKILAALSYGIYVIGISGIWNWMQSNSDRDWETAISGLNR